MQKHHLIKITEKEFTKIPLFRNVRQINGEKIFKSLYQTCKVHQYNQRTNDKQLSLKQNFIYVKEGEVLVYKVGNESKQKTLIKSYRGEEYCGFQDYPLFWGEQLQVQVTADSTLVIIPLGQFYRFFRRVIPMTYLQSKAEYLKRLPLFKGMELQKIFKLACISQKYRVTKQKILTKQGEKIENIFLICSGKLQLKSSLIKETIYCRQNEDFLVKQVREDIPTCYFTAKCILQSDILVIPKEEFKKMIDIRFKLKQTLLKDNECKENILNEEENDRSLKQITDNLQSKFEIKSLTFSKTCYERSKSQKTPTKREIRSAYKPRERMNSFQSEQLIRTPQERQSLSLGQIQLLKFIRRKQKMESKNFFKYIESRAPEIVLNPSKQFALIKPLYKSSSQYVRNMKRKIKQSMILHHSNIHNQVQVRPFQI